MSKLTVISTIFLIIMAISAGKSLAANDDDCDSDLQISEAKITAQNGSLHHQLIVVSTGCDIIDYYELKCWFYYDEPGMERKVYQDAVSTFDFDTVIEFVTGLPEENYAAVKYEVTAVHTTDADSKVVFYNNNALPVVINEIMYRTTDNIRKWVEIYVNKRPEYLEEMSFITQREVITFSVTGGDYILITNRAADADYLREKFQLDDIPIYTGLSNLLVAGEELTLKDPSGNIIESFTYQPEWSPERNVSIERINPQLPAMPENWGPSIAAQGATPGARNSIYTEIIPAHTTAEANPNPFSPDRNEYTIISFEFPERLNRVTCRIYDLKGRRVATLINQQIQAAQGSIIWDGYRENGDRLLPGVYLLTLEAAGYDTEKVYTDRTTVVIGR